MQLEKNSFDFVVFSEVMMHIQNPEEVLISINETLKENGILVFTAINLNGPYSLLYHHFRNNVITKIFRSIPPSGHNTFTLQNYVALFRKTKFEILNITHSNFISFLPIIVKSNKLSEIDCKLADFLPSSLVSGYYIVCRKSF